MINSFLIEKNRYLFFDIFHKNDKLILICPVYFRGLNIDNLKVYCNNVKLSISTKYSEIEIEPIEVLIYDLKTITTKNHIIVYYNDLVNEYELEHIKTEKTNTLAISTLFKDDYEQIKIFYDYYTKQGISNFYLYYNGKLTDEIRSKFILPGVVLIEWDFIWRNEECKYPNHAQMGQLHQALYKYSKDRDKYIIFCDFDEYLYIPNTKLINYFESDNVSNVFGFRNIWADTLDGQLPSSIPNMIKCSNDIVPFGIRSKCVYKVDDIATVSIHHPKRFLKGSKINSENVMFHFYKWSGQNRTVVTDSNVSLKLPWF